jgi:hypothetical protein
MWPDFNILDRKMPIMVPERGRIWKFDTMFYDIGTSKICWTNEREKNSLPLTCSSTVRISVTQKCQNPQVTYLHCSFCSRTFKRVYSSNDIYILKTTKKRIGLNDHRMGSNITHSDRYPTKRNCRFHMNKIWTNRYKYIIVNILSNSFRHITNFANLAINSFVSKGGIWTLISLRLLTRRQFTEDKTEKTSLHSFSTWQVGTNV